MSIPTATAHFMAVPHAEEMGARLCPPYGVFALNIVGSEQFIQ